MMRFHDNERDIKLAYLPLTIYMLIHVFYFCWYVLFELRFGLSGLRKT